MKLTNKTTPQIIILNKEDMNYLIKEMEKRINKAMEIYDCRLEGYLKQLIQLRKDKEIARLKEKTK